LSLRKIAAAAAVIVKRHFEVAVHLEFGRPAAVSALIDAKAGVNRGGCGPVQKGGSAEWSVTSSCVIRFGWSATPGSCLPFAACLAAVVVSIAGSRFLVVRNGLVILTLIN